MPRMKRATTRGRAETSLQRRMSGREGGVAVRGRQHAGVSDTHEGQRACCERHYIPMTPRLQS